MLIGKSLISPNKRWAYSQEAYDPPHNIAGRQQET